MLAAIPLCPEGEQQAIFLSFQVIQKDPLTLQSIQTTLFSLLAHRAEGQTHETLFSFRYSFVILSNIYVICDIVSKV